LVRSVPLEMTAALPLRSTTPDYWAESVLRNPSALLSDHAYLERKAASNVLELLNRWPNGREPESWVTSLSAIARDETQHLQAVARLLKRRGGNLERLHKNLYARDLRTLVRRGLANRELLDRLLVSALIEGRSCERFETLGRVCRDEELAAFYKGLCSSEKGHYRVFLQLAKDFIDADEVETRWNWMLDREAEIIAAQPVAPRLHSGVPKT